MLFSFDIKDAYRHILLNPNDWYLLGTRFQGKFYCNCYAPFGGTTCPGIFSRFSDATRWILQNNYNLWTVVNILDDFLFAIKR